jgi:hypothetical protein
MLGKHQLTLVALKLGGELAMPIQLVPMIWVPQWQKGKHMSLFEHHISRGPESKVKGLLIGNSDIF